MISLMSIHLPCLQSGLPAMGCTRGREKQLCLWETLSLLLKVLLVGASWALRGLPGFLVIELPAVQPWDLRSGRNQLCTVVSDMCTCFSSCLLFTAQQTFICWLPFNQFLRLLFCPHPTPSLPWLIEVRDSTRCAQLSLAANLSVTSWVMEPSCFHQRRCWMV